ncbi:MAG: phosphate/phosphite/phosphonate ABC transporter substrate-binding protein [Anaerolineales bacterium]|nr:phosphate/phosphite/phosphonate ABC transporter substrate-binding protein [Anaerolineales bacterium]
MIKTKQYCKIKKVLLVLSLILILGCSFPVSLTLGTPTVTPSPEPTSTPTQPPPATPQPGTDQSPLILALAPSTHPSEELIASGEAIAAYIESRTGYRVVTVVPVSEAALVEALDKGNAHIASLSPYGFVLAHENDSVTALLARVRDGEVFYGSQIIANRDKGYISYYDESRDENMIEVEEALKQFEEKKPCWSDEGSPSGYVVPFGLLSQAGVKPRSGAFLEGQPNVVRAVYSDDICDFGATFIDARTSPVLEADYPDVMDKVIVVWRIPKIIPYENISAASSLPIDMRRVIQRALIDFMITPEGKDAIQTVYGFDEMQPVEDAAYAEFIDLVTASGLDLLSLIE